MTQLSVNIPWRASGGLPVQRTVLAWLLAVDLVLIALHIAAGITLERIPPLLNIAMDWSLAEMVGYGKWALCAVLLGLAWRRSGLATYGAMALVLCVMTLDDFLQIHERLGTVIAQSGLVGGHAQDMGELVVFGGFAVLLAGPLLYALWVDRRAGIAAVGGLILLIAVLVAFGVGVDAIKNMLPPFAFRVQVMELLEEGGEMLVGSLIVAHVVAQTAWGRPGSTPR